MTKNTNVHVCRGKSKKSSTTVSNLTFARLCIVLAFTGCLVWLLLHLCGVTQTWQNRGPSPQQALAGNWVLHTYLQGRQQDSVFLMRVNGSNIEGQGKDGLGPYCFAGRLSGDKVQFTLNYLGINPQMADWKPVIYEGKLSIVRGYAPYMRGAWRTDRTVGQRRSQRILRLSGEWEAAFYVERPLTRPSSYPANSQPRPIAIGSSGSSRVK